ncbi:transmembrane protein 135-like [Epargyreus clarus]|uniref:transmembrane protein 135-like n=1 Tax=Epargyreus clarus TaxID=520877 RepID=UPI003C2DFCB7
MVEVSKQLFESTCSNIPCHHLLHPWNQGCWTSTYLSYKNSFIGSAKFYLVVHLAQNLARGKKILNKEELKRAGENYVRSTIFGALVSGSCSTLGCLFRWLLGNKFRYHGYILLPSTLNGVGILLEPPSRRGLIVNLFSNMLIEYWIRSLERAGYMKMTKAKQTVLFMFGSAILFYLMRLEGDKENRTPLFWIYTPDKVRRKTDHSQNVCPHEGLCSKYIMKGSLTYFTVGLAFSLARVILPKYRTPLKALTSIRWHHFDMAMFFGSYIGIYRAVVCYLCNKRGYDSALYALPAGYIAGLSFLFKPTLGFAIASLTAAFKVYSTILYEKKILPEHIPLPLMLYCISQGTLFHSRFMHSEVCPSYIFKLMNTVSNGCADILYANMLEVIKRAS